jgi:hypothetical protein
MKKYLIFSILLLSLQSFAQSDYTRKYNQAKQLFEKGKYDLARYAFSELITPAEGNFYQEYAYYYHSLADFYLTKLTESQLFLNTLLQKFPETRLKEEVNYLLANIAFEKKDDVGAMVLLSGIQQAGFQEDIKNLKRYYFTKKSLTEAKSLQKSYPNDEAIAEVLYYKIKKIERPGKDDQMLLKNLAKQYNFSDKQSDTELVSTNPNRQPQEKSSKKDAYNIAVLFPFSVGGIDPNRSVRGNQLVLDMFEGMQIAKKDLESQNVKVNIRAFDIGKDANDMLELVNTPEFEQIDLIVGPLYPATNQVAVTFANEKSIALINPISSNAHLLDNNPSAFLLRPSLETRSEKAAEFAATNFPDNLPVIILTGVTEEDSTYAYTYEKFIKSKGFTVQVLKELGTAEVGQIAGILAGKTEKNLSHIFVSTSNAKIVSTFMNVLEKNSSKIPVLTPSDWFKFDGSFERYEQRNVHFIFPEYMDSQREPVRNFKQAYLRQTNLVPSAYACYGYELTMFFSRTLYEFGTKFAGQLHEQKGKKGWLFSGHSYWHGNDNKYVPIFKFEDADFKLLNPIEE